MFPALVDHILGPDGSLNLTDVGAAQKQHTEPGLSDTAAYGQRQVAGCQHLVVGEVQPLFAAGSLQLFPEGGLVDPDAHGRDLKCALEGLEPEEDIAV